MNCYIILKFSAIDNRNNVISEMDHDIFQRKRIIFSLETIGIKRTADKFYSHTYLTLILFMLLTLLESISFVKVMVQNEI